MFSPWAHHSTDWHHCSSLHVRKVRKETQQNDTTDSSTVCNENTNKNHTTQLQQNSLDESSFSWEATQDLKHLFKKKPRNY